MTTRGLGGFLQGILCKSREPTPEPKFVDLAPTAKADNAEIYFEALDYATNNDDVLNIALTGPYGSGKSSVIKSFLARYPGAPLQLSLASFTSDAPNDTPGRKQAIERSILQQILYGVEADRLPFSRFKRIRLPRPMSIWTSVLITAGLAGGWYLFNKQAEIVSGAFFDPFRLSNWFNYVSAGVFVVFVVKIVHGVYTTSFGLSLKSISLKDVQIAPAAANEESILNRHFDEILYFFQSTKYDLVVIEDLDRFEDPDIFVTLREINGLINGNEIIKRPVRFLYALRDDIFTNTDRTKFFEFIVPIIPVINHSNSIDKVLEQVQRIDLHKRLNTQFLREVSRHLTDMRLIRNIVNEYVVYAANLKVDSQPLDPNKLLAILIYKNVMPKDFAALHRQEGALSQLLRRYDQYISKIERDIHSEISSVETDIEIGEAQALRDQSELRKVYAMAVIARIPTGHYNLQTPTISVSLGELADSSALEEIISQKSVLASGQYVGRTTVPLPELESSIDPTRSFEQRKADIDRKSTNFKESSEKRLRKLKSQLASLRTRRFNEVVRESASLIEEVFAELGENRELLKYLVLEGHLDDTYYQYISLFHGGRLSPNDHSFLVQIRAYSTPPPDFPLDNVAEVIVSMRSEDFGHNYVLNRFVFDHLLSDVEANARRVDDAIEFIASHFDVCGDFFRSYYAKGAHVEKFIQILAARWPNFAAVALEGTDGASHAARILAYMPDPLLVGGSNAGALRSFLADNAREVLEEGVDFDLVRLLSLSVEVADVESLVGFPDALLFVVREGLYRISIDNIRLVLDRVVGWQLMADLEKRHLSTLNEANDEALLKRIDRDFPAYVGDVLLPLDSNTDEDMSAVSEVLEREEVGHELRAEFLRRQTVAIPNFDSIPASFHRVALEGRQVEPTWKNCFGFMTSEFYEPDLLTAYLQDSDVAEALSQQPIPGDEASLRLRKFVIGNDALTPEVYRLYVRQLPKTFNELPEVNAGKVKILIDERKLTFSPAMFGELKDSDLQVLFVATNYPAYEVGKGQYSIDDGFRAKLLRTGISDPQKLDLIGEMQESFVVGEPSAAADIGTILDRSPMQKRDYSADFIKAVILNARPVKVQISLFNKLHPTLSISDVREVLLGLPGSFKDIAIFGRAPKIENSDVNRQLVTWLRERSIISSFGDTAFGDEIRVHTFKKAP